MSVQKKIVILPPEKIKQSKFHYERYTHTYHPTEPSAIVEASLLHTIVLESMSCVCISSYFQWHTFVSEVSSPRSSWSWALLFLVACPRTACIRSIIFQHSKVRYIMNYSANREQKSLLLCRGAAYSLLDEVKTKYNEQTHFIPY